MTVSLRLHTCTKSMGGLFMCCVIIICILQSWRRMLYRISFLGSGTKGVLKIKTHLSETFFLLIAKNHLLNILKSQHYHENVEDYVNHVIDDSSDKEIKILKEKRLDDVQQAIRELSPQKRRVVEMKLYHNSTNQEVADKLAISVNTVKSLYTSALHDLRRILALLLFLI